MLWENLTASCWPSDFDDTFITGDLVVPPENLRALNYFTGEGGTFTIATRAGPPPPSPPMPAKSPSTPR